MARPAAFAAGPQSEARRHVSSPRSPNPACRFPAPGSPVESCGSHTGCPVATSGRVLRAVAPGSPLALAGRCVVRPVDALTTATARVVPFAYACDDVWHSCSFIGVIGRSATPGACSLSPSLPPEAPSLGRHCPASTVVRASPPPWPAELALTGRRLARATPPAGLPVLRPFPYSTRATAITPAEPVGARVARFPTAGSLPRYSGGSASALPVSRPARRLLALWPAWSLNRPGRPFVVGVLQPMSLPPSSAPTATGWSDSCRAGFAPAEE